jgi:hypothetical protein
VAAVALPTEFFRASPNLHLTPRKHAESGMTKNSASIRG